MPQNSLTLVMILFSFSNLLKHVRLSLSRYVLFHSFSPWRHRFFTIFSSLPLYLYVSMLHTFNVYIILLARMLWRLCCRCINLLGRKILVNCKKFYTKFVTRLNFLYDVMSQKDVFVIFCKLYSIIIEKCYSQ